MRKKRDISTIVFVFIFLAGFSVMMYPTFANWWNNNMASHTVSSYKEAVAQLDDGEADKLLQEAHEYNKKLAELEFPFTDFNKIKGYDDILNISGTGIMGYISIPNINVELPIYHGTSEGVLQIATGHIQGSSLPVGGKSTHAVISGHRGLPSARLFTDLDKIVEGDIFTVNILNEVLTYEVEQILVILPDETDKLSVFPNEDIVTLMTCTPYGINSHRLLIRAHRIATVYDKKVKISADAMQIDTMKVFMAVLIPLVVLLLLYWNISSKYRKNIRIDRYIADKLPKEGRDKDEN